MQKWDNWLGFGFIHMNATHLEWHLPARYLQMNNSEIHDIHDCEQRYIQWENILLTYLL